MDKFSSYGTLYSRDFTVEKGIDVQIDQLRQLKKILNVKTFNALKAECLKRNHSPELETGYDVFRGSQMNTFVHNLYR